MGLQPFCLTLTARPHCAPPAFATAIPAMFEALLDVFAPLDVSLQLDGGDFLRIAREDPNRRYGASPLWVDEELTREPLTKCRPTLGTDVIAELCDRLAGSSPRTFYIAAEGALLHRAAETAAPEWYGRWRLDRAVHELVTVTFTWTADPLRGFELKCPMSGYPFTSARPLSSRLADGDPAISAENRALLFPALCRVRGALGFDADEVEWRNDGSYRALYPDDGKDIAKRWMPQLRAS